MRDIRKDPQLDGDAERVKRLRAVQAIVTQVRVKLTRHVSGVGVVVPTPAQKCTDRSCDGWNTSPTVD